MADEEKGEGREESSDLDFVANPATDEELEDVSGGGDCKDGTIIIQ